MPEYEIWKDSLSGNANGWSIKYYKVCAFILSKEPARILKNFKVLYLFYALI